MSSSPYCVNILFATHKKSGAIDIKYPLDCDKQKYKMYIKKACLCPILKISFLNSFYDVDNRYGSIKLA